MVSIFVLWRSFKPKLKPKFECIWKMSRELQIMTILVSRLYDNNTLIKVRITWTTTDLLLTFTNFNTLNQHINIFIHENAFWETFCKILAFCSGINMLKVGTIWLSWCGASYFWKMTDISEFYSFILLLILVHLIIFWKKMWLSTGCWPWSRIRVTWLYSGGINRNYPVATNNLMSAASSGWKTFDEVVRGNEENG